MEELKKLYDTLVREGYYTNSYEEFVQKYNGIVGRIGYDGKGTA